MEKKPQKRVGYSKRKYTREQELRMHLMMAGGALLAVILLVVVIISVRSGLKKKNVSGQNNDLTPGVNTISTIEVTPVIPENLAASAVESVPEIESVVEEPVEKAPSLLIDELESKETDMSVDWNLVLVNPKRTLTRDFYTDTADIGFSDDEYFVFDERAVDALDEMLYDCENQVGGLYVRSAWRSWGDQEGLLDNKVEEWEDEGYDHDEAYEIAATYVAPPGTSEHQLGLAVDIASDGYETLNANQENSPVQQWLHAHCAEYGFILRYPDNKSDITGIVYEPWHYRYVGKEAAQEIMSRGICLEEYLAEKKIGNIVE